MEKILKNLKDEFQKKYKTINGIRYFFAPGRVNLIGEHTDYNGGYVLPTSLDVGTYAVVKEREDRKVRFSSQNFDIEVEVDLNENVYNKEHDWANYPKGVIKEFQNLDYNIKGFDVIYYGNIPNGAGLSSSASIELVTAVIVNNLNNCDLDMIKMVQMSQKAENDFVGLNCGIMDQFAIGMGKRNKAMFLKCDTLDYNYVPIELKNYKLIITNSNRRRGLADSKYNERRNECERAVKDLSIIKKIDVLADIDVDFFEKNKNIIKNGVDRKRAEHVIYEIERVKKAVECLNNDNLNKFGELMDQSHISLRDKYEVTGFELDTLVEEAWKIEGCIGSRMTGAGFGGCTVSLVKDDFINEFKKIIEKNYYEKTRLKPEFYIVEIGNGAREIF